jgi:TrmH family RNA methyltransferase
MKVISSKDNEIIKKIKSLKEKKYRDIENCYIIEGIKLVKEAIAENAKIKQIVVCEDCINDGEIDTDTLYEIAKFDVVYVTEKVFKTITDVKTPQGIIAVIEKNNINSKIDYSQDIIIALDGVQDPGNLGTILRTVDSANLKQIILSKESADSYNPKVVRSTMGAIFRVNIIEADSLKDMLQEAKKNNFKVMVTSLDTKNSIYDVDYSKKVIVIGNEANGVSKEVQAIADEKVKIPMLGKTESLNASVAAGIMIYEYVRKKLGK